MVVRFVLLFILHFQAILQVCFRERFMNVCVCLWFWIYFFSLFFFGVWKSFTFCNYFFIFAKGSVASWILMFFFLSVIDWFLFILLLSRSVFSLPKCCCCSNSRESVFVCLSRIRRWERERESPRQCICGKTSGVKLLKLYTYRNFRGGCVRANCSCCCCCCSTFSTIVLYCFL